LVVSLGRPIVRPPRQRAIKKRYGLNDRSFALLTLAETGDGAELVELVLDILRGRRGADVRTRLDAAAWLANRAFGRPLSERELGDLDSIVGVVSVDLRILATPEIIVLKELIEKASDSTN
jgi:hypothetical protein